MFSLLSQVYHRMLFFSRARIRSCKMLLKRVHFLQMKLFPNEGSDADARRNDD
jgi:hypothetical protein